MPAGGDEVEEGGEGLVLVRGVGVEEAEGHHGARGLVQHGHVDPAPTARAGGLRGGVKDLKGWIRFDCGNRRCSHAYHIVLPSSALKEG